MHAGFVQTSGHGMRDLAALPDFPGGVQARLHYGGFHDVDSDQLSFELCARLAFRNAGSQMGAIILEPIMAVEVVTPEEYMGSVVGDLNKRRGLIEGMDSRGNDQVVKAKVPLAELFGYVTDLRTITSGRALSTMQFDSYAATPRGIQEEVIAKVKGVSTK